MDQAEMDPIWREVLDWAPLIREMAVRRAWGSRLDPDDLSQEALLFLYEQIRKGSFRTSSLKLNSWVRFKIKDAFFGWTWMAGYALSLSESGFLDARALARGKSLKLSLGRPSNLKSRMYCALQALRVVRSVVSLDRDSVAAGGGRRDEIRDPARNGLLRDAIPDLDPDPTARLDLESALARLTPQERRVVRGYFYPPYETVWDLASHYRVADHVIRRIRRKALGRIRESLSPEYQDAS